LFEAKRRSQLWSLCFCPAFIKKALDGLEQCELFHPELKDEALFIRKAENLAREWDFIPNAQLLTSFPFRFPFWGRWFPTPRLSPPFSIPQKSHGSKNISSYGKFKSLNENRGELGIKPQGLRLMKGGMEVRHCLWEIFEKFSIECPRCDDLDACLIKATLDRVVGEAEYLTFRKKLKKAIRQGDIIWKQIQS
jgi:hypothetical protein